MMTSIAANCDTELSFWIIILTYSTEYYCWIMLLKYTGNNYSTTAGLTYTSELYYWILLLNYTGNYYVAYGGQNGQKSRCTSKNPQLMEL